MKDFYTITFTVIKETDKAILVKKKTKKIDKSFWIPKSVMKVEDHYLQKKNLPDDAWYLRDRIKIKLPRWFCDKELGFYR